MFADVSRSDLQHGAARIAVRGISTGIHVDEDRAAHRSVDRRYVSSEADSCVNSPPPAAVGKARELRLVVIVDQYNMIGGAALAVLVHAGSTDTTVLGHQSIRVRI